MCAFMLPLGWSFTVPHLLWKYVPRILPDRDRVIHSVLRGVVVLAWVDSVLLQHVVDRGHGNPSNELITSDDRGEVYSLWYQFLHLLVSIIHLAVGAMPPCSLTA